MKLGLVVPRYGTEVVGGTEHWLRTLLRASRGPEGLGGRGVHHVRPVRRRPGRTSTRPAIIEINGVTVHRHRSVSGRDPRYLEMYPAIRADPEATSDIGGSAFRGAGRARSAPSAIDEAESSDCDLIAVTPYLFWPAVHGVPRLGPAGRVPRRRPRRTGAAPAVMATVFAAVGGFAFNSYAERRLVERTFPVAQLPARVIGQRRGRRRPATRRAARLGLGSRCGRALRAVRRAGSSGPRERTVGRAVDASTGAAARTPLDWCSSDRSTSP